MSPAIDATATSFQWPWSLTIPSGFGCYLNVLTKRLNWFNLRSSMLSVHLPLWSFPYSSVVGLPSIPLLYNIRISTILNIYPINFIFIFQTFHLLAFVAFIFLLSHLWWFVTCSMWLIFVILLCHLNLITQASWFYFHHFDDCPSAPCPSTWIAQPLSSLTYSFKFTWYLLSNFAQLLGKTVIFPSNVSAIMIRCLWLNIHGVSSLVKYKQQSLQWNQANNLDTNKWWVPVMRTKVWL